MNKEHFIERVTFEPNSGCWLWLAGVNSATGYGEYYVGRHWSKRGYIGAHRADCSACSGAVAYVNNALRDIAALTPETP